MPEEVQNEMSLDMAGRLLGIGPERIRQLSKAGYIKIHKRGMTALVPAVQGYIKYLKDENSKGTKTAAASRATDARAREIELRIAREERQLIPKEDADLALDLVVGEVNKQFTGLAARITRDVSLRRKIEAELYEAKRKIAEALGSGRELAATGRDPTDTDATDAS
jgi:hypothetical protein